MKLSRFQPLEPAEIQRLDALHRRVLAFEPGQDLVQEGQGAHPAYVLESGWGYSYKVVPGGGRQVVVVKLPGDLLGLRSVLLHLADHSCASLTPVVVSELDTRALATLMSRSSRLATSLLWSAALDEAMIVEHLVSVGRRSATARVAHFFLELETRLDLLGQVENASYACPLSQQMVGDLTGLTPIHVNRVLRRLRESGLMQFRRGRVTIEDRPGLSELAGFDGAYLHRPHGHSSVSEPGRG